MNEAHDSKVVNLRLDDIIPNRFQPREVFDENGLQELSDSIKEHGVIQPIIVRKLGDKYELIAGERRTKATALAGLTTIPAIIRDMDDNESAKVSLLENLQRKNLSAIEEARTYKRILELDNMTQEDLARSMGRSQPMVANKLRLLSLPEEIQEALMKNQISERHARSLLTLKNKKDQLMFLDRIRNERLTVRELDLELKKFKENNNLNEFSNKENEKNDERSFMNNNIGNFGGMGLNDYQSGVTNNMFNNIPNNFNNMNNINNNQINYNNFEEGPDQSNNQANEYLRGMNQDNNNTFVNGASTSSLGSMFDSYNNEPENYQTDNNENSNLFVSHIREDNLPKVENQFLPNFDNFKFDNNNDENNDGTREALNQFNQNNKFNELNDHNSITQNMDINNNNINTNYQDNNYNDLNTNNTHQNNFNLDNNMINNNPNYNFDINNRVNPNFNLNNNYNQNMNNNFNMNNDYNTMGTNNYYMNDLNNNYMNNQNNMINNGHNSNFYTNNNMNNGFNPNMNQMNNFGMNNNYNPNTSYGNYNVNNPIPDFNSNYDMNQNMYQQNQGGMFEEPLNIIDVPRNNIPLESQQGEVSSKEIDINEVPTEQISQENSDNYNNILFSKPNTVKEDMENDGNIELEDKEIISNPSSEIEVIGEEETSNEANLENKEEKNDYIKLDPVYTINSTMDAVLELKKTTDKIKQNHIDIETEEIDFDDVYQITIKIKKTDTL